MTFDDKDLIEITAVQRNNALSESAMAQAVIRDLQRQVAERDARIAGLEKKPAKKKPA